MLKGKTTFGFLGLLTPAGEHEHLQERSERTERQSGAMTSQENIEGKISCD